MWDQSHTFPHRKVDWSQKSYQKKSTQNILKGRKLEENILVPDLHIWEGVGLVPDLPVWEGVGLVTKVLA